MFTEQAQQLLDQAKTSAMARGERELSLEFLLMAVFQNAEIRFSKSMLLPTKRWEP
jgi:hypothetical protein